MLKLVLNDYKYGFNQGIITAARGGWMIYVYVLTGIPLTFHFDVTGYLVFYFSMIPMLLALLLSRMYANIMNKTLLMCPLSREQRMDYFNTALGVRIVIPSALFFVLDGILALINIIPAAFFFLMMLVMIPYVAAVNIYCTPKAPASKAMNRSYDLPGTYELWNVLIQTSGLINMVILVSAVTDKGNPVKAWECIVIGCLIGIEILLSIKMILTYYKPVYLQTTSYEVQKKVEMLNTDERMSHE